MTTELEARFAAWVTELLRSAIVRAGAGVVQNTAVATAGRQVGAMLRAQLPPSVRGTLVRVFLANVAHGAGVEVEFPRKGGVKR